MRRARSADLAMQPMRAQRRGPAYPTRLAVRARPALLARHVPNAWRRRGMRRLVEVALASGAAAGATGCILPFPGVVFTRASHYPEDEARQTIRDVMHRYGIEVVPGTKPIGTLRLRDDPNDPGPPYIPDLESTDGRWVFEYISADDVERCHTGFVEMHNSVLRTSARWGGYEPRFRTFSVGERYWPLTSLRREPSKDEARRELEDQVRHFCEWIATQERP